MQNVVLTSHLPFQGLQIIHIPQPAAFSPKSKDELLKAVGDCVTMSPEGDCSNSLHGPIGEWDVSDVTDMSSLFQFHKSFNADLSKWNVARVTDMSYMFRGARSFNADISNWNVASVTDMTRMFFGATSFNVDLSEWNVARVTSMAHMFEKATSFNQRLCAWVHSPAYKFDMFDDSPGSICATAMCPKCGVDKDGALSCCFRNGAWFKKCGNPGDSKFEHTWLEGNQACKSARTTPTTTSVITSEPTPGRFCSPRS